MRDLEIEAIELPCRWAEAVDRGDWDAVMACFTPSASADLPKTGGHSSAQAIVAAARQVVDRLEAVHHHLGGQRAERTDDAVIVTSSVIANHVRGGSLFTFGGRYTDRVIRVGDEPRIDHRRLTVLWTDGDPAVLDA